MAFTATVQSIIPVADVTGISLSWIVLIVFADSVTGFTSNKTYTFSLGTTQATAVAAITADGNTIKAALASVSTLASKVGSVITI